MSTTTMNEWEQGFREHWEKILAAAATLLLTITQAKRLWKLLKQVVAVVIYPFTVAGQLAKSIDALSATLKTLDTRLDGFGNKLAIVENRAHEAHALSREHFEASAKAYFECSAKDGSCVWTNTALQKMFHLSQEQTRGFGWLTSLHPDDLVATRDLWDETIKKWTPYRVRYRLLIDGKATLVEASARVIMSPSGEPLSVWGSVEEVK